jgi:hypothetical protein
VEPAAAPESRALLLRRIARLRGERSASSESTSPILIDLRSRRARAYAERLASALQGDVVETPAGRVVRIERAPISMPVDRSALASLPEHPAPHVPLVCLDTETTGLGTAAGTIAFLVGVGWWDDGAFRQVQLVLPDQGDEAAFLATLRQLLPPDAWLVTYNGRGFDWPLLVTRYRLGHGGPPALDGHLDLLPVVRALFRHRLPDARLRTVESDLLRLGRVGDLDGSEIPARYLGFLRDGDAGGLVEVVRHNHEDVRSLARLLVHVARGVGRREPDDARDLAALGRFLARHGRLDEGLECLDRAAAAMVDVAGRGGPRDPDPPWWSPRVRADVGGRPAAAFPATGVAWPPPTRRAFDATWTRERIERERARFLRRAGRSDEAVSAWRAIALRGGRVGVLAWIEVAKLEEHVRAAPSLALDAVDRASALALRLRRTGLVVRGLDDDLARRRERLARRLARAAKSSPKAVLASAR